MAKTKHKVFISYHHKNDAAKKEELQRLNDKHEIFIDESVDTGDIDESLEDDVIREKIRDDYLKDSTVTILLVGTKTKTRKHIDWEIYSSMYNGKRNKQSGVLVVNLPSTACGLITAAHGDREKNEVYPNVSSWTSVSGRQNYAQRYPYAPERIVDNLNKSGVYISVTTWNTFINHPERLRTLIELTHRDRLDCDYDLSKKMRRANS